MKTIKKHRRIEGKTDYKARKTLLKGGNSRVVIRKTNRYILIQFIKSREAQDQVIFGVSSKELLDFDWKKENSESLKSISAAYLTGLLAGTKLKKLNESKAIIDFGLQRSSPKSRLCAAVKGIVDSGIKVKSSRDIFPSETRIKGDHLKNKIDFDKIKQNILRSNERNE